LRGELEPLAGHQKRTRYPRGRQPQYTVGVRKRLFKKCRAGFLSDRLGLYGRRFGGRRFGGHRLGFVFLRHAAIILRKGIEWESRVTLEQVTWKMRLRFFYEKARETWNFFKNISS